MTNHRRRIAILGIGLLLGCFAASLAAMPNGDGLVAQYFNNTSLTPPVVFSQVEENVDNFWYLCSPDPSVNVNNFSGRWTGYLYVPYSEPYTFSVRVSDAARVWVNNVKVLDNWSAPVDPSQNFNSAALNLTANTTVPVSLEYYENTNEAAIQLLWSSPTLYVQNGNQQQYIPKAYLFTGQTPGPTASPTPQTYAPLAMTCTPGTAITVDGQLNDNAWNSSAWIPITKTTFGSTIAGESAAFQTRWNQNNLYFAVTVTTNGTPLYTDSTVYYYEDPAAEFFLDMVDGKGTTLTFNDYQFVVRVGDNAVTELHGHTWGSVLAAHQTTAVGYTMEVSIPWSALGVAPYQGVTYGLDVGVDFDRDGGCREAQLVWNGKLKDSDDTSAYGNMTMASCGLGGPTQSPSPTLTRTQTPTPSSTPTRTTTNSPTPTATSSSTWTPTSSPTSTATGTSTATSTPSPTATPTATFTASWTASPTHTWTMTSTETPSATLTSTPTATPTSTDTPTSTGTDTPTWTLSPTASPSPTFSNTDTRTASPSPTFTPTATFSSTITPSFTSTATRTLTGTPTVTGTFTATGTPIATLSPTPTGSPTASPTPRASFKPYPDPFAPDQPPDDVVHFPLPPSHGSVHLMVADLGRKKVFETRIPPGVQVTWNGRDNGGSVVPSGVYIYFLLVDRQLHRGTVTVLK